MNAGIYFKFRNSVSEICILLNCLPITNLWHKVLWYYSKETTTHNFSVQNETPLTFQRGEFLYERI